MSLCKDENSSQTWREELFFLHWITVNAQTQNWSKCREYVTIECLVLNKTFISPNSRTKKYESVEEKIKKSEDSTNSTKMTSGYDRAIENVNTAAMVTCS